MSEQADVARPGRGWRGLVAAAIVLLSLLMTGYSFASLVLPGSAVLPDRPDVADVLVFMTIILAFPVVGSVVVRKRPSNPVGWLFLLVGASMALAVFSTEYPNRAATTPGGLPGDGVVAWLGGWAWAIGGAIALPVALASFPDGRLPGRPARLALRVAVGSALVAVTASALKPGPIDGNLVAYPNPVGVGGPVGEVLTAIAAAGPVTLPLPGIVAVLIVTARARRAQGAERQQLKWLLLPLTLFAAGLGAATVVQAEILWSLALLGLAGVPVAAGIAILRYRLYDIDLVIRRTLSYLAVVVTLSVLYAGSTLVLQGILSQAAGGGSITVVLSTLLIAMLFGPVRARARAFVDRRFYRARYDADRVVEAFTATLRDEVELVAVEGRLAAAVERTVHPQGVHVWLRRSP